jgi:hypothetical protein
LDAELASLTRVICSQRPRASGARLIKPGVGRTPCDSLVCSSIPAGRSALRASFTVGSEALFFCGGRQALLQRRAEGRLELIVGDAEKEICMTSRCC